MGNSLQSWGRYPASNHEAKPVFWRSDNLPLAGLTGTVLPYGLGRSYGDVCLNDGGTIMPTRGLNRFISFDTTSGLLCCEAGVSLAEILTLAVPRGWFLPVTPGTKMVTIGGAIANDVHGKNHHVAGTFGCHVTRFELLRSDGSRMLCSPDSNSEYFAASIGGLGLTGLITWAEIKLIPITSNRIDVTTTKFGTLDEFFELSSRSEKEYDYTVAWIDSLASGRGLGRGHFMAGNHAPGEPGEPVGDGPAAGGIPIVFDFPEFVLNNFTIRAFNLLYYHRKFSRQSTGTADFNSFFYPLDSILEWNRIYGRRGLLQYQCLVPYDDHDVIRTILRKISASGQGSFLAVLKVMGDQPSPGLISFSGKGVTLALDFPVKKSVFTLFRELDAVVREAGGRLYSAKDACMTAADFQAYYPQWQTFSPFIDPRFSSGFWRRVTAQ